MLPRTYCAMFFGKRGSGKSAVMARFAEKEYQAGRRVWYWPRDYAFVHGEYIDILDLYSLPDWLKDGVVLIDEIQVLFNRMRTISTSNLIGGVMLQQLRKRNLDIYGTSNQPNKIDNTVALQTDWHAYCQMEEDPRCLRREFHLRKCTDGVLMRVVDTNGQHGSDPRYKDGRRRFHAVASEIRKAYGLYNTLAVADMVEVIGITKEQILQRRADSNMGIGEAELVDAVISQWVPWMVAQGHTTLAVAAFTRHVNAEFGLKIERSRMGAALNQAGLESRRTSKARIIDLPPADKLEAFQMGAWSAQAE